MTEALRVGNCSGFYGDRLSAMREMLEGGPLDVLTGDYLAELTMLILGRDKAKDPALGYAKTFLRQLEECLGTAIDKRVQIVTNAGGQNPAGLAEAIDALAGRLGLSVDVAYVDGDDVTARAAELDLPDSLAANAYLGAFGIAEGVRSGADVVVTGRVTDASVIIGPAIARFDWQRDDYDALAGATTAGHIIECGTQATGGNFAFFTEIRDLLHPGFPIAEIRADGSSVITKHPGTAGAVTVDTVTAQLLYEIGDERYLGPDVTTRLDSIRLVQEGQDRVLVTGVVGEPPPATLKVSCNRLGGYRNQVAMVLTGLDIEAKADLARRGFQDALTVQPEQLDWELTRTAQPDADTQEGAAAKLIVTARDRDPKVVGRAFSNAGVEIALASYPGFHSMTPPADATAYGVYTPGFIPQEEVSHRVCLPDGTQHLIGAPTRFLADLPIAEPQVPAAPGGRTVRAPLGTVAGARSGDKGGNANVGVWARDDDVFAWLAAELSTDRLKELLPEATDLVVHRTVLANLRAVNFVIEGLLGEGVAYQARFDPQAKGIGEWLRSRHLEIPAVLLPGKGE